MALAFAESDPAQRRRLLLEARAVTASCASHKLATQHLAAAEQLIARQLQVDGFDATLAARGDAVFVKYPRTPVTLTSLHETMLCKCCCCQVCVCVFALSSCLATAASRADCTFYHPNVSKSKLSSGKGLIKAFGASEEVCRWSSYGPPAPTKA